MKPKHLALPIIALTVAGVLLGVQRRSVSDLREGNGVLRERIAEARAAKDAAESTARPGLREVPQDEAIDWEKLAEALGQKSGASPMDTVSIQRRLLRMDTPELLAALDRIAAMDLDDATRSRLQNLILDPLAKKDPEAALERFKGKIGEPGIASYLLGNALKQWAGTDLAAATAWLDGEIAAGTFDPKSLDGRDSARASFEAAIVFAQFGLDPAKAEERLSRIPAALRADVLRAADGQREMSMEDEIALAAIGRRQLDESGRVSIIGGRAASVIQRGGDFAAVDGYLNSVYAAPDERERAVRDAASRFLNLRRRDGGLKPGDIDSMREWVKRDLPEDVDSLTGGALASAVSEERMGFSVAAERARHYQRESGNDGPLFQFLRSLPQGPHWAEARELVWEISDPAMRASMAKKFSPTGP